MKRLGAGALTFVILSLLLWSGLRRGPESPKSAGESGSEAGSEATDPSEGATDHLRQLLSSAREGNVDAYLDAFSGPLRERLEREANDRGRTAFSASLRQASQARKSHALFSPEPAGPNAYLVTMESVYPDRNERQTYRIEREGDAWRVTAIDTLRTEIPKARYGAPASFEAPEGIPVSTERPPSDVGDTGAAASPRSIE